MCTQTHSIVINKKFKGKIYLKSVSEGTTKNVERQPTGSENYLILFISRAYK